jgi:hypothetical protein
VLLHNLFILYQVQVLDIFQVEPEVQDILLVLQKLVVTVV